jgi:hypothetical protein
MQKHRFVCLVLTVYDIFRWVLMTAILVGLVGTAEKGIVINGAATTLTMIPYLLYAAAPALFPLMTLFLWLNRKQYRPFASLYIAGKIIGIVAVVVWCYFNWSLNGTMLLVRFGKGRDILYHIIIPFLTLLDALSVLGIFTIREKE